VVVYAKAAFPTESGFERSQIMLDDIGTGEVDHLAAAGAYQVMVVLWCTGCVARAVVTGMELTYKPQFRQQLEGAVDGYQADTGVVLTDRIEYCRWSEVVLVGGKGMYYRASLWSELVAVSFEGNSDTSI